MGSPPMPSAVAATGSYIEAQKVQREDGESVVGEEGVREEVRVCTLNPFEDQLC